MAGIKRGSVSKKPKRLLLKKSQLMELKKRIAKRSLDEKDWDILDGMADTIDFLYMVLDEKSISLRRLLKYMLGAPTETCKKVLGENADQPEKPPASDLSPEKPKAKGHGRNAADVYDNANKVTIEHPSLKSGDPCPECDKGKVYEMTMPSVIVRVVADAPLKATVYELLRLRCNLCGEIFTPELPPGTPESKYDESVAAMIAFLRYGCGMPLHRLGKIQKNLGVPLAASTQWGIIDAAAQVLSPVHDEMTKQAAQGNILHNDDTTMQVLSLLNTDEAESTRKGIFTSGIVSINQENKHRIALFVTGHHHAGENLNDILSQRNPDLVLPIQMCDALSRNTPKDFQTIIANCLVHARRNFVDLAENFPEESRLVIELLAKVYGQEKIVKDQNLTPAERLVHHQRESAPLMQELKNWCDGQIANKIVEPNSSLGKAIKYMQKHWDKLTRFLTAPGAPLDNNLCEQILKQAITHRKNSMFYKTENGAHVGDLFMSLIHTCQMAGENPFDYLTQLLRNGRRIKETPENWMPWNYRENFSSA
jgi:transposase